MNCPTGSNQEKMPQPMGDGMIATRELGMSVILATPDNYRTIRHTVLALQRQTVRDELELVIVAPRIHGLDLIESDLACFARYRVIEMGEFTAIAAAYAEGVRAAGSPIVAFTESHSFPAERWAEALIARHQEAWTGVGPVFRNANPETAASWANFLLEYGHFADPVASVLQGHIPGHNSSYKRKALLEFGEELEKNLESESPMQWEMSARGHRFCLEPEAKTYHLNFSVYKRTLLARYFGGRLFAGRRARRWTLQQRAIYTMASPLIPLVRLWRCIGAARRIGRFSLLSRVLPPLLLLLVLDAAGEAVGYITGKGRAVPLQGEREFHRERYLASCDREVFTDSRRFSGLLEGL
jgi:hypothetical protein